MTLEFNSSIIFPDLRYILHFYFQLFQDRLMFWIGYLVCCTALPIYFFKVPFYFYIYAFINLHYSQIFLIIRSIFSSDMYLSFSTSINFMFYLWQFLGPLSFYLQLHYQKTWLLLLLFFEIAFSESVQSTSFLKNKIFIWNF